MSIKTEATISSFKDVKGNEIPSPYDVQDASGSLIEIINDIKSADSSGGASFSTSTLEGAAAAKIAENALKPYKKYINTDLKPTGVEDDIYNIIDISSLYKTGDPRLTIGEVLYLVVQNYSNRIVEYSKGINEANAKGLDSLQITAAEVYKFLNELKDKKFKEWDTQFVSYLKSLGRPVEGMFTTPSNEYFVKVGKGNSAMFVKYFYDRRYQIAKEFRAPLQQGEYFPIYPINNAYFKAFYEEAEAFRAASLFHYDDPYSYTNRKETKEQTSPNGLSF